MKKVILVVFILHLSACSDISSGLNLDSCHPKSGWQSLKETFMPKSFWIEQHGELAYSLAQGFPTDHCQYEKGSKRYECLSWAKNTRNSVLKCFKHTTKMCNINGGRCTNNYMRGYE